MKFLICMIFLISILLANNTFSQSDNTYIAGTPYFFEELDATLEILTENKTINAIITCKNNTGVDVYIPNHYIVSVYKVIDFRIAPVITRILYPIILQNTFCP